MIELQELTKEYGKIKAIEGLSFRIEANEIFGLLGPNGAGKSTTIKILTTLVKPTGGRALLDGIDVMGQPMEIKKRIAVVPQENNLDREMSAFDNLRLYGLLHHIPDLESRIEEQLRSVGLWERRNDNILTFSGGMQRRLLIARAVLGRPRVLFLDEPTIGLDPQVRREIWNMIRRIKAQGGTILLTTHYIEEAEALSDRVGILSRGEIDRPRYPGQPEKNGGGIRGGICGPGRQPGLSDVRQPGRRPVPSAGSRDRGHHAQVQPGGRLREADRGADRAMNWYPIFLREMIQFKKKLFRLGYIFTSMMVPLLYLLAFGLGLGRSVQVPGGTYLGFLLPGLVAMSSMNNSYNWVASGLNLSRVYFKTFQVLIQAPIAPTSIMTGYVLAGMVRGLFASVMIILVGLVAGAGFHLSWLFLFTLLLNCFLFANMGVLIGMLTKTHEDTSTYANFFILPMVFFSGTFFPIDRMPKLLQTIILCLPLTHTNILIRKPVLDGEGLTAILVMIGYAVLFFILGSRKIKNYSE